MSGDEATQMSFPGLGSDIPLRRLNKRHVPPKVIVSQLRAEMGFACRCGKHIYKGEPMFKIARERFDLTPLSRGQWVCGECAARYEKEGTPKW